MIKPMKTERKPSSSRKFRLDRSGAKLAGVCGGIAQYFGFDPVWVRIGFVASCFFSLGFPLLLYIAMAIIAD